MNQISPYAAVPKALRSQFDYILLDGSGSMQDKWWESLDAIDAYVGGLKSEQVNSHIMLSTFTSGLNSPIKMWTQRDTPISDWVPLAKDPIGSDFGMTPLYDAVNTMGRQMRDLDPPKAAITIVTDGEEQGSQHTDLHQAKSILDWCRAKGWQVTFIGADFSNSKQAQLLGAGSGTSVGVAKANLKLAASALAKKRAAFARYGTPMHYTKDEQVQFGGYLGAPK